MTKWQELTNTVVATTSEVAGTVWRHRRRGTVYRMIGVAIDEANLVPVAIYQQNGGAMIMRPLKEFMDGRFEQVTAPAKSPADQDTVNRRHWHD